MAAQTSRLPLPVDWRDEAEHRRKLAQGLNAVLDGKINATGTFTFTANSATTALSDARIGPASVILLQPTTANAATAMNTWYVSARATASATLTHSNNAQTDRTFDYVVLG